MSKYSTLSTKKKIAFHENSPDLITRLGQTSQTTSSVFHQGYIYTKVMFTPRIWPLIG